MAVRAANLVDALRRQGQVIISLVAEVGKELVGNVVLTPVTVMPTVPGLRMLGLGPVAMLPGFQRRGIGSMLVREAVGQACAEGWPAIVVLGDPGCYYEGFGFVRARRFGLGCEFEAPEGAFMVMEVRPGTLNGLAGTVRYSRSF